jgi:excisionase family DNA binding protein
MKTLTVTETATRLGISSRRVLALISSGRLPAEKLGPIYTVKESDLKLVEDRKPGRPSKQAIKQKTEKKSKAKG